VSLLRRERRALPESLDPYQISARPYFPNYSGEIVTEASALAHSALMAAVALLADSIAVMPLELLRDRNGRTEKLPTPSVLIKPNAHQTMFEFVHQTVTMLALHGTAYIYAPRRSGELPPEMRNLHPSQVKGLVQSDTDEYAYQVGTTVFSERDVRAI